MQVCRAACLKVIEEMMRANKYIYVLTKVMVPSAKVLLTGERKFKDSRALSHKW